ncbi:MAG: type II toxin-antitoxin system mRNA interferase toxin, RelE/StbE family [Candidatus Aenigmarchaeota archaeon ex4484_56]|nr:MAG: type II toxin-antitoxin system mRNA interferase toxin, RelE/StbE family [Candidatus Aenigmarchaeota archaeon ex4484_56]
MSYNFRITSTFIKKRKRLPKTIKKQIDKAMKELLCDPYSAGFELVGNLEGLWKKRVGKYRIIYEINEIEKVVIFHTVDLRKKIYRTLR